MISFESPPADQRVDANAARPDGAATPGTKGRTSCGSVFLLLQEERAKVDIKVPAADIQAVIGREG